MSVHDRFQWYLGASRRRLWSIPIRLEALLGGVGDRDRRLLAILHRRLGIPADYAERGLPRYRQASDLVQVPCGLKRRVRRMTPATSTRFIMMRNAAASDGVELLVRWAYRSYLDQADLFLRDMMAGKSIDELLTRIAAPGYSEHHTGRALDFEAASVKCPFQDTETYEWLCRKAHRFDFHLSFLANNPYGIVSEPWHWCFQG